ncbi:ARID DNA-binding domain-containing protein [Tanacetum coccineum]
MDLTFKNNKCRPVYMFKDPTDCSFDENKMNMRQNQYMEDYFKLFEESTHYDEGKTEKRDVLTQKCHRSGEIGHHTYACPTIPTSVGNTPRNGDYVYVKGVFYPTNVSTFNEYVAFLDLLKNDHVICQEWDIFRDKFIEVFKWFYNKYLKREMPGPIPPIINGTEIHLMDLYKLIEGLGGYLSVYFELKFGTIGEILGLSKQDEEDVKNCYIKYLDIFTSYYKTAKVPNQDQRSNLDILARTLEVVKGYTYPTTHQWDFGESSAPILEVTNKKGKEKMEHFGIKLEEEKEYHGRKNSHSMQPNKGSILYNDTKIKEEETSSTSSKDFVIV